MSTEYRVTLDRAACDGVFACLVRDDRFAEAADGLATIGRGADGDAATDGGRARRGGDAPEGDLTATFDDGRLGDARRAARACPLDAIDVTVTGADDE